jgi:hypothetical protein
MGVIKGIFLVLFSIVLFVSLFSLIFFGILSSSLTYSNVETQAISIIHNFIDEGMNVTSLVTQNYPFIQEYCKNYSNYVFNAQGYTFDIPCSISLQGQEAIIEEGIRDLIHQVYYKDYGCQFLDCFNKSEIPVFLISEQSANFFSTLFYCSIGISFILILLCFFLIKKKSNFFILLGIFLIILSLPFIKIASLINLLSTKITIQFLTIFFSESSYISILSLLIGIISLVFGLVFGIGFSVFGWFSKFKKEIPAQKSKKSKSK